MHKTNRPEKAEINPRLCDQLIYDKLPRTYTRERTLNKWYQGNEKPPTKERHLELSTPHTKLPKIHNFPHQAFPLRAHLKMDPLSSQSYIGHVSSLLLHLSLPQWCLPAGPEDTGPLSTQARLGAVQKLKFQYVLRRPMSHLCPLTQALSGSQSDGQSQTQFNQSCGAI